MTTVPNQDVLDYSIKEPCGVDKENVYAKININAIKLAIKDLTPAQFEVWMYFAKNQADYTFAISPAAALSEFGIKKDTFQKAKVVLKEKGYLIENPAKGKNHWIFREIPIEDIMYVEKVSS